MVNQQTSIRTTMDRIMQHPLLQDITLEQVIDMTVNFMRLMGTPSMFEEKVTTLTLVDYRASLPDDFYQINQIRFINEEGMFMFRLSTDSFHMSDQLEEVTDLTYKIQGTLLYTTVKEGTIELSYRAISTDEEGYPLLPDNSSFTRALELFVKKSWFTILFDLGKISPGVLQNTQQEYSFAAGDCQAEFNRLNLDTAESFYNMYSSMLIRKHEYQRGFRELGKRI